jgi:hypothetical protein
MIDQQRAPKLSGSARAAIGSLFKAVTLSTDPAHTLGFTASLINSTRSILVYKLEQSVPDSAALPALFNSILKCIVSKWKAGKIIDEESMGVLNKRIDLMFKSESWLRYNLETYRDIGFCDDLHNRWKDANSIYQQDKNAWSVSNDRLADINKQLMEIITRHDLMEFPRGDGFNLDDHGTDTAMIAAMMAKEEKQGRDRR